MRCRAAAPATAATAERFSVPPWVPVAACASVAGGPAAVPHPCDRRGKPGGLRCARGDDRLACVRMPAVVAVAIIPPASLSTPAVSMDIVDMRIGCTQSGDAVYVDAVYVDAAPRWLGGASYAHSDAAVIDPSAELTVRSERLLLCREVPPRCAVCSGGPQSR